MKSLIILLSCILVGTLALTCKQSWSNVHGKDHDLAMTDENCKNVSDQHCVKISGYDKEDDESKRFVFRGCYSDVSNQDSAWGRYYNSGQCQGKEHTFNSGDGKVSGVLYCCDTDKCNTAPAVSTQFMLLLISIFALFYSSFSFAC